MIDHLSADLSARMPADYLPLLTVLADAGWRVTVTSEPTTTLRDVSRENIFLDGYRHGADGQTIRITYVAQYPAGTPAVGFTATSALAPVEETLVPVTPQAAADFVRLHPTSATSGV